MPSLEARFAGWTYAGWTLMPLSPTRHWRGPLSLALAPTKTPIQRDGARCGLPGYNAGGIGGAKSLRCSSACTMVRSKPSNQTNPCSGSWRQPRL
jgi:hypothetical protein